MKIYTTEELRNIMFSPFDYPLVFPDNIGLDYRDAVSHTELRIKHPDGTRHVTLAVESFLGNEYSRAKHVYGRLVADGVVRVQGWWTISAQPIRKYHRQCNSPLLAPEYTFSLKRPLKKSDMKETDGWGNLRWEGRKPGEYVFPFESKQNLIECAKMVFCQCFTGKWSLWMEDATGPGIVRTLLMPEKLNNTDYGKNY